MHQNMHAACFGLAYDAQVLKKPFLITQLHFSFRPSLALSKFENRVHAGFDQTDASTDPLFGHQLASTT